MLRNDFLMRELKRALDAITRALGMHKAGDDAGALDTLGKFYDDVLGEYRTLLDHTDSRTLATLMGTPERLVAIARGLGAEAEVLSADQARAVEALLKRAKATELMLEAIELGFDDDQDWVTTWAVPDQLLSQRAQTLKVS